MPELRLDVVDAAELAELLQFLGEWLARDPTQKEAASPPLIFQHAGYGAAPPAPRLLRIACGDGLGPVLTPETTAAPGARKSRQAQACPRAARGAQTPPWQAPGRRAST